MNLNINQLAPYPEMLLDSSSSRSVQKGMYRGELTPDNTFEARLVKPMTSSVLNFHLLEADCLHLQDLRYLGPIILIVSANNQMPCDFCQRPYDPIATRWLCPHCHMKTNCCDGAPCPLPDQSELKVKSES